MMILVVVAKGKKRKCDLLEVYTVNDIKQIQRYLLPEEWEIIRNKNDDKKTDYDEENMIEFVDAETTEYIQVQEQRVAVNKKVNDVDLWNIVSDSEEDSGGKSEESSEDEKQDNYKISQRTDKPVTQTTNKIIVDGDEEIDIDDI